MHTSGREGLAEGLAGSGGGAQPGPGMVSPTDPTSFVHRQEYIFI